MARRIPRTLDGLKKNLKKTLPERIAKVVESYDSFASSDVPEDAKGFAGHHSACKAAVAHAESLLKLAKWTEDEQVAEEQDKKSNELIALLAEAREDLED